MTGFYLDEHTHRAVARELQKRGYTVVRAVEAGMTGKDDDTEHLPYATANQLVMVTFDHPFGGRTQTRTDFYALVCLSRKIENDIGRIIEVLVEFAELFDPEKDTAQVYWLG